MEHNEQPDPAADIEATDAEHEATNVLIRERDALLAERAKLLDQRAALIREHARERADAKRMRDALRSLIANAGRGSRSGRIPTTFSSQEQVDELAQLLDGAALKKGGA